MLSVGPNFPHPRVRCGLRTLHGEVQREEEGGWSVPGHTGSNPHYSKVTMLENRSLDFCLLFCFVLESGSHCAAQAVLPLPPRCWDYGCALLH
jgi:hypothetical protein